MELRWIEFPDGRKYTFAVDIQKLAEKHGYKVPCESDGTRHPGTDCNRKMRKVVKDIGLRRTFGINDGSVVDVRTDESEANAAFVRWLINQGFVSDSYLKGKAIQLYRLEAVNALLSVMLKAETEYAILDDYVWEVPMMVTKRSHNFEMKQNRPIVSLFNK